MLITVCNWKRAKEKKTRKEERELGIQGTGGGKFVAPVSTVLFSCENLCFPNSKVGFGAKKITIFSGTRPFIFCCIFLCFPEHFSLPVDVFLYVITSKIFAVKSEGPSLHCCVNSRKWKLAAFSPSVMSRQLPSCLDHVHVLFKNMENPLISGRIQLEWFISVEVFKKNR